MGSHLMGSHPVGGEIPPDMSPAHQRISHPTERWPAGILDGSMQTHLHRNLAWVLVSEPDPTVGVGVEELPHERVCNGRGGGVALPLGVQ